MEKILKKLINLIKDPKYIVFWNIDGSYKRLNKVKEIDEEIRAYINDSSHKYIDLYNICFDDITICKKVNILEY